MTKMEFLEGLRKALGNDLDRATVQENVNYYDGYISDEVSKGKTEEEVTADDRSSRGYGTLKPSPSA